MLASALLTAHANVPPELYAVYAVFMEETMSDREARHVFLNATDPEWRRDWVTRWVALKLEPGETVRDLYPRFLKVLGEAFKLDKAMNWSRELKQIFADKIYDAVGRDADPITEAVLRKHRGLDDIVRKYGYIKSPPTRLWVTAMPLISIDVQPVQPRSRLSDRMFRDA
ncbi:hypothetical protein H9P43_006761 [Blastocladiella emersonii ATCC 22665]|nr:hypothetical protein H9P43_006761 [Blastocladiella emersonii ATCC 22665]